MLGMQKRAELTGEWAAKDWSWHKYRNSCGEAEEAAKLQALRQRCDLFDGRRRRRGRAILVRKPHSPNTGQKKGSQNYWGPKDGALSETAKFGPLFLAAASLSPTWAVITTRTDPPGGHQSGCHSSYPRSLKKKNVKHIFFIAFTFHPLYL
jgi:hypothetical protein